MGFCRRCGDIVAGTRCKCGGAAVAPVVPWKQADPAETSSDRWSKTYVSRTRSLSPVRQQWTATSVDPPSSNAVPSATKRFPCPTSGSTPQTTTTLSSRVSEYIATTASQTSRPHSPLKRSTLADPTSDILPSLTPHDTTLSKVYGSILQPKETLTTHSCAICSSPFPPDSTIYPHPSSTEQSFLCKPCFIVNGGSRGNCHSCSRPVLMLKSEGGFVHAVDKYWHKRCFNCAGCFKNIGDSPVVDLLGRPSCADCFGSCLKRDPTTPKKGRSSSNNSPRVDRSGNLGGFGSNTRNKRTQEASPAIEELEQRLGINRSREGSPLLEELSHRLSTIGKDISSKYQSTGSPVSPSTRLRNGNSGSDIRRYEPFEVPSKASPSGVRAFNASPVRGQTTGSTAPTQEAIEEMKQRLFKGSSSSPATSRTPFGSPANRPSTPPRFSINSRASISNFDARESALSRSPSIPPTPDLISDFSDTMTQSSHSEFDSPPRNDEKYTSSDIFDVSNVLDQSFFTRSNLPEVEDVIIEETRSQMGTPTHTPKKEGRQFTRSSQTKVSSRSPSSSKPKTYANFPSTKQLGVDNPETQPDMSASTLCSKCGDALCSISGGGKFITITGGGDVAPSTYHADCFRCSVCNGIFKERRQGQATYVKAQGGPCHVECAPVERVVIHQTIPSSSPKIDNPSSVTAPPKATVARSSSKPERPPLIAPSSSGNNSFPRFGSRTSCPGCQKTVSPMECGVVPGPHGTRWHSSCLVCGGKKEPPPTWVLNISREERKKDEPGCGKRLDSAAKSDGEGGIWCRECTLLLGLPTSPQSSPTRTPLVPSYTGSGKLVSQYTGTTTIARQFTGLGGDPGLLRQLTGGGLSPTRSVSPTKQLGTIGGGMRPRPKSVIGMRSAKSVDEGRGMFLVRQLTGSASNARGP